MNQTFFNSVLTYKNQNVIDRFCEKFSLDNSEAQQIFQDMLLWLCINYFNTNNEEKVDLYIDSDLLIIDEMWHCFILHTKDYEEFCFNYFKRFIHHQPTSRQEKQRLIQKLKMNLLTDEFKLEKKKTYSFIYDNIGKEAFLRWFKDYPIKYKEILTFKKNKNGTF